MKQDVESPAATLSRKLLAAPRRVRAPCVSLRRARIHGEPSRRRRRMTTAAPRARSSVLISNPHDHPRSSPTALLHPPKKASRRRLTSTPRDDGRRESSTMIMLAKRKNTRTSCYKQREKNRKHGVKRGAPHGYLCGTQFYDPDFFRPRASHCCLFFVCFPLFSASILLSSFLSSEVAAAPTTKQHGRLYGRPQGQLHEDGKAAK